MRSIFGRINTNQKPVNQAFLKKSIDKLCVNSQVKEELIIDSFYGFGQVGFSPFKEKAVQNIHKYNDLIILSDSVLYDKTKIINELEIVEKSFTDDFIILKAYEKWGEECLNYLLGDFSFAIWNSKKQELFCARDHFGVKPFYYFFNNESLVFSSGVSAIMEQTDLGFSIDEQYIADTISLIKSENLRTSYKEINKLPPAHYLIYKDRKLVIEQYWKLKPQKTIRKREQDIINEFKVLIQHSVKCRISEGETGSELSGGLDSSIVAGIASQITQIKTFSHVLPEYLLGKIFPFKDEREYINLLTDFCKISNRNFITSEKKSLLDAVVQNVIDFKHLTQLGFGIFSDQLYQKAKEENITVLLSGFGGDEAVTSQSLAYLSELAKNGKWKELKIDLRNQKLGNYQFLKLYLKSKLPILIKISRWIKGKRLWKHKKFENLAINRAYSKKYNQKKRYLTNITNNSSLQERNINKIIHPHVSQRLEYCALIARKYGIEYRYPLLDKRLIEYYLTIPTRLKARNGIGRYIIRRTIEGIVPEKIQWRNDKSGATIPTVFMRMMNDKEKIEEIIIRAKSNQRITKYIDIERYEQWFKKLCKRSEEPQKHINPGAFFNYLKLIFFIEQNPSLFE
ncbi:asparagine synthase-related protein [Bacteroidota bacterium]